MRIASWPFIVVGMRTAAVVLAGLVVLGGCVQRAKVGIPLLSRAEAQAALQHRIALCRVRYPEGSHFLDKAQCDGATRREALLASGTPADLVEAYLATRADVASRLDHGEITREQAEHAIAKAGAEVNEQLSARRRASAAVVTPAPGRPRQHLPPPVPIQSGAQW